ncbi:hypothetical protein [Streptomyces sp. NPDC001389]|uniref:hypothetical protein n=1 Tax=Streptomyces sp. NPDC001389 TaxID=3364569 RepID=UPI003697F2DC
MTVVLDATLVRAVLVPAAMQLAGRANWWLPHWARRHYRFGRGSDAVEERGLHGELRRQSVGEAGSAQGR